MLGKERIRLLANGTPKLIFRELLRRKPFSEQRVEFFRLWLAKTLADFEINEIAALRRHCSVITRSHVSVYRAVRGNAVSPLARASEPLTIESGATSTTHRPETPASAAKTIPGRQTLLGRPPPILFGMETSAHCGHARNRGALAQRRIPLVLEADLQDPETCRETTDAEGSSGIDLPDGR